MNIDAELDVWRRQWQSGVEPVPPDLLRKVELQSRFMKIAFAADILVTAGIGGGVIALAVRSPKPDILLLAIVTWLFIFAAWTFSLTVNRGTWSPAALDTASFVDLSIRHCRARLAAVRFGTVLYLSEIAFCLGWIYRHAPQNRPSLLAWLVFSSLLIDMVWMCTLAFFAFLFWYRRKKRAELAWLLDLQRQISEPRA